MSAKRSINGSKLKTLLRTLVSFDEAQLARSARTAQPNAYLLPPWFGPGQDEAVSMLEPTWSESWLLAVMAARFFRTPDMSEIGRRSLVSGRLWHLMAQQASGSSPFYLMLRRNISASRSLPSQCAASHPALRAPSTLATVSSTNRSSLGRKPTALEAKAKNSLCGF